MEDQLNEDSSRETASFTAVCVNQREFINRNMLHLYVDWHMVRTLNRMHTQWAKNRNKGPARSGREGGRGGKSNRWTLSRHAEESYLSLLLGWRRSCWTAASAAAMAAPASSRWVWVTLVLLWLRDGPWERKCPSEDDLELPGLLCDFSMVGTCISDAWGERLSPAVIAKGLRSSQKPQRALTRYCRERPLLLRD